MKVLFIYPRFHTNSLGWVDALNKYGISVTILAMYKGVTEDYGKTVPKIIKPSILTIIRYKLNKGTRGNVDYYKKIFFPSVFYAIRTICQEKPDILICRDRSMTALIFCLIGKIMKINVVIYDQTPWLKKEGKIKKWITRVFFSPYIMKPLIKDKPKELRDSEFYIPFAVPDRVYPKVKEYNKNGRINFIAVGKYESRKNLKLLIDIVGKLSKAYNITLRIIGETGTKNRQHYYNTIVEKIKAESLGNIVFLLKNIPHDEMNKYFQESDVFLLPSVRECASVSQLEAMAFGLPVIIGSDNGTAEYVENNKCGRIVKIKEPYTLENNYELEKAMEFYCENSDQIRKHGEYARNLISEKYCADAIYIKFSGMMKAVIQK